MFSSWFPRTRRGKGLRDFLDEHNNQPKSQGFEGQSPSQTPDRTGSLVETNDERAPTPPIFEDNEDDGTFPQQTPVAQYGLQGSLIWDFGLRTYFWLAGYGILRLWGGVAGSVKEDEDEDGL